MSLATVIPVEIVNHILSFRPRHPDAELIQNFWEIECDGICGDYDYTFLSISSLTRYYYKKPLVFKNILASGYLKNKDKEYRLKFMDTDNNMTTYCDYAKIYNEYGTYEDVNNDFIYGDEDDDEDDACSVCGEYDKYYSNDLDDWFCRFCDDNAIWCENCRGEVIVGEGETLEDYMEEDLIYCRICLDN